MDSSQEKTEFDIVIDATGVQPYMFEPLANVNSWKSLLTLHPRMIQATKVPTELGTLTGM